MLDWMGRQETDSLMTAIAQNLVVCFPLLAGLLLYSSPSVNLVMYMSPEAMHLLSRTVTNEDKAFPKTF
jgi:hypothetical protein